MPKILIVDDSEELLELFSLLLKKEGYSTGTASSKSEMLARLPTFEPDLILMDVRLGGNNGRDVCKLVKQESKDKKISIILLSASPELLKDYEECLADDIIEKPFDIKTVIEKIRALTSTD